MTHRFLVRLSASLLLLTASAAVSAPPTEPALRLETAPSAPPAEWRELAEPIRKTLSGTVLRVRRGEAVVLELWPVAEVTGAPGKADGFVQLPSLPVGALWGVVRWAEAGRDVRSNPIRPGVYTLRYGRQPADGDHLGLTDYRDFLLLLPAAADREPAPPPAEKADEALIAASRKTTGKDHPAVLMLLRPAEPAKADPLEPEPAQPPAEPAKSDPAAENLPRLQTRQLGKKTVTLLELAVKFREQPNREPTVLPMAISVVGVVHP